jgi:GNAT superfamily N-acetyltransferase
VKRLDERTGEIKRMFVVPGARGRGHASRLLAGLEDAVRRRGYSHARLDTGPKQPQAEAMYVRAGYTSIPDYNANPLASFWGEKQLT